MSPLNDESILKYINEIRQKWCIPAVSVTLIDLDKSQSETKGFGHPTSGAVDEESIWCIASNTKLFTVFALAILVEEGKLSWDSKLCDLFPELDLQDKCASKILTLEDVLSHRSGIPAYLDAEFSKDAKLEDIVLIINALRPNSLALKTYQYSNIFYSLAGLLTSRISGLTYPDFIQQRILDPLGMTGTSFGKAVRADKVVTPCAAAPGLGSIDLGYAFHDLPLDNLGLPGGGLLASGKDMQRWFEYLLKLAGDRLDEGDPTIITPATFTEILRSRTLAGEQIGGMLTNMGEALSSEFSPPMYALGLYRCHYRGLDMAHHWGGGPGAGSVLMLLPQKGIALAIFTNLESAAYAAAPAMALGVLDSYRDLQRTDWMNTIYAMPRGRNDVAVQPPTRQATQPNTEDIIGTYSNLAFGKLHVFTINTDPNKLTQRAADKLDAIQKAAVFGPAYDRRPDCYGVYEKETLFGSYLAIFHVKGPTYWAETHYLSPHGKNSQAAGAGAVWDVANSVAAFPGAGQLRLDFLGDKLEWYKGYSVGQPGIGKGNATFVRCG